MNTYQLFPNRLLNLADVFFGERREAPVSAWVPAVDVTENETGYQLATELPGVTADNVKVVVRDGVLTLSGERAPVTPPEGSRTHLTERVYGSFQRRFSLPKNADGEAVSAEFKNDVLFITVAKREEVKPKEIEIKIAA